MSIGDGAHHVCIDSGEALTASARTRIGLHGENHVGVGVRRKNFDVGALKGLLNGWGKYRLVACFSKCTLFHAQGNLNGSEGHIHTQRGALQSFCRLAERVHQGQSTNEGRRVHTNLQSRATFARLEFFKGDVGLSLGVGDGFATRGQIAPFVSVGQGDVGRGLSIQECHHGGRATERSGHVQGQGRVQGGQLQPGDTIVEHAHKFLGDRRLRAVFCTVDQRLVEEGAQHVEPSHGGVHDLLHLGHSPGVPSRFQMLHGEKEGRLSFGLLNPSVLGLAQLVIGEHLRVAGVRVHQDEPFQIFIGRALRTIGERLGQPLVQLLGHLQSARGGRGLHLHTNLTGEVVECVLLGHRICVEGVDQLGGRADADVVPRLDRRLQDPVGQQGCGVLGVGTSRNHGAQTQQRQGQSHAVRG